MFWYGFGMFYAELFMWWTL